jgi:hypothetical protein
MLAVAVAVVIVGMKLEHEWWNVHQGVVGMDLRATLRESCRPNVQFFVV